MKTMSTISPIVMIHLIPMNTHILEIYQFPKQAHTKLLPQEILSLQMRIASESVELSQWLVVAVVSSA